MTSDRLVAEFVDSPGGRIFLLLREPPDGSDNCVLFVPPFGEEMNKSRRQATETAFEFSRRGWSSLIVDLYGTGDSEGEFEDASWETWKGNLVTAVEWAEGRKLRVRSMVSARLGCALAAQALRESGRALATSVFWQPVTMGGQFVNQFLRLRIAASMMEADRKETVEELKGRLKAGESLEVAGYSLGTRLWHFMERIDLAADLHDGLGNLKIIEVGRAANDALSVPGQKLLAAAERIGLFASGTKLAGEPFWSTAEIVVNRPLSLVTCEHVTAAS